ncbi:holo-ACP synthase [Thiohalorhabdus sp.]|uniref:holo-ACP synthase n=1 Tax=Thiohalorhabdus sp. TaxID=3094134 RepID=UPI002FC3397D
MILGLGTDLVAVDRVRSALESHGERFLERVLTASESELCRSRGDPALCVAARFAAKEAGAKALGTGIGQGVRLRDLEVVRESAQPPQLCLHGQAAAVAAEQGIVRTYLSLSDEPGYALALVVMEGDL